MNYKNEMKVSIEAFNSSEITDEIIYRQLVRSIIDAMSIDDLSLLFFLKETDPFSRKNLALLSNPETPEYIRDKILLLKEQRMLLFEAQCKKIELL